MFIADDNGAEIRWVTKDRSYIMSRCELSLRGDDMHVKMSGGGARLEFDIDGYRDKTALEAMEGHDISSGDAYLGRHFEDCVFQAWRDLGLDDGYVLPVLRDIRKML